MKKYKAIIIDGKKLVRRSIALAIVMLVGILGIIDVKIASPDIKIKSDGISKSAISESIPVVGVATELSQQLLGGSAAAAKKALSFVLTFDPRDLRTAIFGEIPLIKIASTGYLAKTANQAIAAYNPQNADMGKGEPEPKTKSEESGVYPITEVDSGQGKALQNSKNKILIRNDTDFGININEMTSAPLAFDMRGDEPKVLILHTHTTESYSPEGASTYSTDKSDRNQNPDENMIAVGEAFKKVLEQKGISAIHDTTVHDYPSFNGSYENARKTIEGYKAKYPGLAVVFDLHRDAFICEDGSKAKFVTEINGQKAAQLMIVVGTNGGGLDHPDWRENMKFALKLQTAVSQKYPSLMRAVNLRKERFNGHTTKGSIIIEVGSSGNTLAEAVRGAILGAEEIADFLNTLK